MPRWKDAIDYWITLSDRPFSVNSDPNRSRSSDKRSNTHDATHHSV
ncbi:MAG: hypothetical protein GY820_40105 [Gammaproteobacteria bacterium]|nr:hypothetical protein [Gammaproteobacteria bacterium]